MSKEEHDKILPVILAELQGTPFRSADVNDVVVVYVTGEGLTSTWRFPDDRYREFLRSIFDLADVDAVAADLEAMKKHLTPRMRRVLICACDHSTMMVARVHAISAKGGEA